LEPNLPIPVYTVAAVDNWRPITAQPTLDRWSDGCRRSFSCTILILNRVIVSCAMDILAYGQLGSYHLGGGSPYLSHRIESIECNNHKLLDAYQCEWIKIIKSKQFLRIYWNNKPQMHIWTEMTVNDKWVRSAYTERGITHEKSSAKIMHILN